MNTQEIDIRKTALVLIDLQKGIVNMADGQAVVDKAAQVVEYFRQQEGFIAFVHVDFLDGRDQLNPITDQTNGEATQPPADWSAFVPELKVGDNDYVVTKRQWGAFFGTDLDIQLRRRGIDTIVLGGISTNIGVESTAREVFQHGYNQIFLTDAMKATTIEEHEASCSYIFPKIGKLRTVEQFLAE